MEEIGELVQLYIYDLSAGLARSLSPSLLGMQIDGIWHTSIVVGGLEYYFGGGINVGRPGETPFGSPVEILDLGNTQIPSDVRESLLIDLSPRFSPEAYSLFDHNCNTFSDEFAQLLTGKGIPSHITSLPRDVLGTPFGQMLRPLLGGMEEQLRSMRGGMNGNVPVSVGAATDSQSEQVSRAEHALEAAVTEVAIKDVENREQKGDRQPDEAISSEESTKFRTERAIVQEYERLVGTGYPRDSETEALAIENVGAVITRLDDTEKQKD